MNINWYLSGKSGFLQTQHLLSAGQETVCMLSPHFLCGDLPQESIQKLQYNLTLHK